MRTSRQTPLNSGSTRERHTSGTTLMEVLVASSIGVVVLGALLTVVTLVAEEERRGWVAAGLQQQADLLEDRITRLIRAMSAGEAVILGDPVEAGSPFYHQMITAQGSSPIPREKLAYQPASFTCTHTPDLSSPTVQESYCTPSSALVLRNMYLSISEKNDGAPDASSVAIVFQMDDNGAGVRHVTNIVTRSFTVTMRNN